MNVIALSERGRNPEKNRFISFWSRGYRSLLPILPPDADISPESSFAKLAGKEKDPRGKAPGIKNSNGQWQGLPGWQKYQATEQDLMRWNAMGASVGLRGDENLFGLDIDATDEDLADRIERDAIEMLGPAPVRIGNAPKRLLLYRSDALVSYPVVTFQGLGGVERVELLSAGRQFVVSGIHPKTGRKYKWPRGVPAFEELTVVSSDVISSFFAQLATYLPAADLRESKAPADRKAIDQESLRGDPDLVRRAVAALPNTRAAFPLYDDMIRVGEAIHAAVVEDPALGAELFHDWAGRWEGGDYDFEIADKNWRSFKAPHALGADWLYSQAWRFGGWTGWVERWHEPIDSAAVEPAPANSNQNDWPEPVDVFGDGNSAQLTELPAGALPSAIEGWARDTAERMGAPPAFAAAAALATLSGCLGARFRIQPQEYDTGWTEPAFLWFALVEEPGGKKSPIIAAATKALAGLDAECAARDQQKWLEWNEQKARRKRTDPPLPPEPKITRYVFEGFTMEALTRGLKDNPNGALVRLDELTQLFGAFDAYKANKGADRPLFLALFDGRETRVDRASKGLTLVPCWGVSVVGGIQPRVMQKIAPNLDADGLLQRFLTVLGDGIRRVPVDRAPDPDAQAGYSRLVRQIADLRPIFPQAVQLSPEARAVWRELATRIDRLFALPNLSDAWKGHLGKWPGISSRLLLVMHAAACWDETEGQIEERLVSGDTARRTSSLCAWLLSHSMRFYAEYVGAGQVVEDARAIAGLVLAKPRAIFTRRDIYQGQRDLRSEFDRIARAMLYLESIGWCRALSERRDRYGASQWSINPAVHTEFKCHAESEKQRRETAHAAAKAASEERAQILLS